MAGRGKNKNQIVAALGRELLGFVSCTCALAHQARNRWDRGTYVRCVLTNTWTALEMACNDALDVTDIGYSFRKKLDSAVEQKGACQVGLVSWGVEGSQ